MTQELVLGVLLSGLIGLVWVMTLAMREEEHRNSQESEASAPSNEGQHGKSALKHGIIAA
jgi:hypothetical protein